MQTNPAQRSALLRATALVALSALGFGSIAIFVTFATRAGAGLFGVLSWRYILASLILVPLAMREGSFRFDRRGLKALAIAGIGQAAVAVVSLSALRYIPAATLSFLFYTFPAWVALIARVRHSEPLTAVRLTALALSLGGIVTMVGAPGSATLQPAGVALALTAALLYAVYIPTINALQRGSTGLATSSYMSVGAGIVLTIAASARGELAIDMGSTAWIASIGLALVSTVAAFVMFLAGLKVLGSVRTAIISTVEPFFTAILAALLLAQPLTFGTLVGGALIAAAVVLLQLKSRVASAAAAGRVGEPVP